jgi:hypothetical protein
VSLFVELFPAFSESLCCFSVINVSILDKKGRTTLGMEEKCMGKETKAKQLTSHKGNKLAAQQATSSRPKGPPFNLVGLPC